jgi:hypothetical protein
MGRTIVREQAIDRRPDHRQTDLLIREGTDLRGEILEVVVRAGILVAIPGEIDRLGMRAVVVPVETREAIRRGEMLGIVLEIPVGMLLEIQEGLVRVAGMPGLGLEATRLETRVGLDLRGMQGRPVRRPITLGLRAILMRDFRSRVGEAVTGHKDSDLRNRLNSGLSNSLNRGRRLRVHDRADSAGITMPEQRGRRAIAVEPVPVAVVDNEEVEADETSQS